MRGTTGKEDYGPHLPGMKGRLLGLACAILLASSLAAQETGKAESQAKTSATPAPVMLGASAYEGLPETIRGRAIESWGREVTRVKELLREAEAKVKKNAEEVYEYEGLVKVKTWFWLRNRYNRRLAELQKEQKKLQETKKDLDDRLEDLKKNDPPFFAPVMAKTGKEWEAEVGDLKKTVGDLETEVSRQKEVLHDLRAEREKAVRQREPETVKVVDVRIKKVEVVLVKVEYQLRVVRKYLVEAEKSGPPSKTTRTVRGSSSGERDDGPTKGGATGSSKDKVWVEGYTRSDGTKVKGHWRSRPKK